MKKIISSKKIIGSLIISAAISVYGFVHFKNLFSHKSEKKVLLKKSDSQKEIEADYPEEAADLEVKMTQDPLLGYPPTFRLESVHDYINNNTTRGANDCMNWIERGPGNVGGRTRAIAFDPNDATYKKVWAGGINGGLWYTLDITVPNPQWIKIDDLWDHISISCIAFDPSDPQRIYVGTGEGYFNADAGRGAGLWTSKDDGIAWGRLPNTIPSAVSSTFLYTQKIIVNSLGEVFAGTKNGGVRKSTDHGTNWIPVLGSTTGNIPDALPGTGSYPALDDVADMDMASDGTIFASIGIANDAAIYRTSNNGSTWERISDTNTACGFANNGTAMRTKIACAPSNPNVIYAFVVEKGSINTGHFLGIWKSVDKGTHWTQAPQTPGNNQAWYDITGVVDPTDENITYTNDNTMIVKSTNFWSSLSYISSTNWSSSNYVHVDQQILLFPPGNPNAMLVGCDGGVFYTSTLNQTTPTFNNCNGSLGNGYRTSQYYACALHPDAGSNYLIGGTQDNSVLIFSPGSASITNGSSWAGGGDGGYCFIDNNGGNPIYIGSYEFVNYYISTTGLPNSFTPLFATGAFTSGLFVNPADYDYVNHLLFCDYWAYSIERVNAIGAPTPTLIPVTNGPTTLNLFPSCIKVSPYSTLGHSTLFIGAGGQFWKVTDANTATPLCTLLTAPTTNTLSYISSIDVGVNDNQLLVTYSNFTGNNFSHIYESMNGGNSWTSKEGNFLDQPVRWGIYNPHNRKEVLLATEVGVSLCSDISSSSPNWIYPHSTLPNTRIDMLRYRASDNLVLAATHGRGLFSTDFFNHPNANFTFPPAGLCINSTVNFTDISTENPTSWHWDFGDNQSSDVQNPIHHYAYGGVYVVTLTVSNASGCNSFSQTIIIQEQGSCCATFTNQLDETTLNSGTAITGNYNLYSPTQNVTIHSGNNAVIDHARIAIPPGYTITIEPSATLTIQNSSYLFACGDMWQGIIVNNGGTLIVNYGSEIDDAIDAIFSNNGGLILVDGAIFDHNFQSIDLENGNYQQSSISGSKFLSSGSTISTNGYNYGMINHAPHIGDRPAAHINLFNAGSVNIGDPYGAVPNIFSYADKGIFSQQTDLAINGNNFYDFASNGSNSFGIFIAKANNASIGNSWGIQSNDFENCNVGAIWTNSQSVQFAFNYMNNTSYGVEAMFNNENAVQTISNNYIENTLSGIATIWNFSTQFNIENNTIKVLEGSTHTATAGISSGDAPGWGTSNLTIRNNYIKHLGDYGILLRNNSSNSLISNNQIMMKAYFYNTENYGIRLEYCTKDIIDCNTIQGYISNDPGYYLNKRGVSLSYSPEIIVKNNTTDHTNTGFEFSGTCNQLYFYGNTMKYHDDGMDLGACLSGCATQVGGVIGDQFTFSEDGINYYTSGNRYEGQTGNGDYDPNGGATFTIASTQNIFDVFNTNPFIPIINGHLNGSPGFPINPFLQNSPTNFPIPDDCQNIIVPDLRLRAGGDVGEGEQIVLNGNSMSSDDDVIQYYLEKNLYEKLKRDSSLIDSSAILNDFYDSTSQITKGKLVDLKLAVEYIYDQSSGNYNAQIMQSRIDDAVILTSNLNAGNLIEENEKRMYTVILNHFANPETAVVDTPAIMSISDIATQCPYIGGPVVYEARALMMLLNPTLKFDDDNYCATVSLKKRNHAINEPKQSGMFYPNPASTSVNLIYDISGYLRGELEIFNSIGIKVKEVILNTHLSKQEINLTSFSNGIYNCILLGDNKQIDEFKLSVAK